MNFISIAGTSELMVNLYGMDQKDDRYVYRTWKDIHLERQNDVFRILSRHTMTILNEKLLYLGRKWKTSSEIFCLKQQVIDGVHGVPMSCGLQFRSNKNYDKQMCVLFQVFQFASFLRSCTLILLLCFKFNLSYHRCVSLLLASVSLVYSCNYGKMLVYIMLSFELPEASYRMCKFKHLQN